MCGDTKIGPKSKALLALEESLDSRERAFLLALSKKTLRQCVESGPLPEVLESEKSKGLLLENHCFVTLRIGTALRGCIGSIAPKIPLYERIIESTRSAALEDPRFKAVQRAELDSINVKISVLTEAEALHYESSEELLQQLVPFKHGVIVRKGWQAATYLPQVWAHVSDKERFLSELCVKAGLDPAAWKEPSTKVEVFESLSIG
ncbi:MAG: AmmeMemoRadiSam system protein A [SAR324 cluster bacterium]|uniref:AmmeMemoRadiSam system protein A n=1 Tax=SAR324 cluster bacterium TaxID=2024889 RepID=A0A7X9FUK6_9DELT|nr:AmmeMemoRadiSam system protein A [SAR324 cluster bacterium]